MVVVGRKMKIIAWLLQTRRAKIVSAAAVNLLLLLAPAILFGNSEDNSLRELYIDFRTEKSAFKTAEPIFFTGECHNRGSSEIRYRFDDLWKIRILDANGSEMPFQGREIIKHYTPKYDDAGNLRDTRLRLHPGSRAPLGEKCISDEFGNGQGGFDLYLPPGEYRVFHRFCPSDTIALSVKDPVDSVEYSAMRELTSAIDSTYRRLGRSSQRLKFYEDFYGKFRNTIYAPRALRNLVSISPLEVPEYNESRRQYYVRELITRFPESQFNFNAMIYLKVEYVPASDRRDFAQALRLVKKHLINLAQRDEAEQFARELEK